MDCTRWSVARCGEEGEPSARLDKSSIFASEVTDEELEAADGMQFNDSNILEHYLLLRLPPMVTGN